MTRFRVVAAYLAHVPTGQAAERAAGVRVNGTVVACDFYQDAILPPDVPQETLDRLLATGMIEPVEAA